MKIDHNNKRKVGRPSLPIIVAVKGYKHHSVNISQSLVKRENITAENKVSLHEDSKGNIFICFDSKQGANVRTKKNGSGKYKTISYTFSSSDICNILLNRANESKKAVFLVSVKSVLIEGKQYYLIIDKPINI